MSWIDQGRTWYMVNVQNGEGVIRLQLNTEEVVQFASYLYPRSQRRTEAAKPSRRDGRQGPPRLPRSSPDCQEPAEQHTP